VPCYPVFLDLRSRSCVVVGGGWLAAEKVRGLLAAEAAVTVLAAEPIPDLHELAAAGLIRHRPRYYQPGDLEGVFLAIVCGQPVEIADAIRKEALERNVLLNTVDDAARCDFLAPAVVRRGDLSIAISTGGRAPALAVRLRQRLEEEIGDEHARFLEMAGAVRAALAERVPDFAIRRDLWYRLVDSDVLHLLRSGHETAAAERFREILGVAP
jgi:precorrin-2 dehydrogenase